MPKRQKKLRRKIQDGLTLDEIEKIFAVEGIALSPELKADIKWLDQQGWSFEERRMWLAEKYGTRK